MSFIAPTTRHSEDIIPKFVERSKIWAAFEDLKDPGVHKRLAENKQTPTFLWIGCSDSRVPPTVVTASNPGDIFVHHNIANQFPWGPRDAHVHARFPAGDINAVSVLTYGITALKIQHIVVVGHTHCGGVETSYQIALDELQAEAARASALRESELTHWLRPLIRLARKQILAGQGGLAAAAAVVAAVQEGGEAAEAANAVLSVEHRKLAEENVRVQVQNVAVKTRLILAEAQETANVWVHGLIFEIETGTLVDLDYTESAFEC